MSKHKVLFPKEYCEYCHRVKTNTNQNHNCESYVAIGITNIGHKWSR